MSKAQFRPAPQTPAENTNGHVLPPEEHMPEEAPPTYEESLDRPGGSGTTRPVVPNRPPPNQNTPNQSQNHLQVPQPPPRPSSSNSSNGGYGTANSSNTSFNTGNVSNSSIGSGKSSGDRKDGRGHSPGPPGPHGRPSHSPGPHGRPPHSPNRPPRQMGYGNRPQGGPAPNNPLLHYPRGYHCPKCDNTGIKKKNGKSCQDCWGMFARPNQQVVNIPGPQNQYTPFPFFPFSPPPIPQTTTIYGAPGAPPPVVVQPGDPRLGGQVCGKCRGRGMVYDWFLGDETCPVCRGVGRVR